MPEYKTNIYQMSAIVDMLNDGWEIKDVSEYQGYLSIYMTKGDEEWHFDMDAIN